MNRNLKFYIAIIVVLIVIIITIDSSKPKPVNWEPTYSIKDKIPFGLYILNEEIPTMFQDQKIFRLNTTPYEYFVDQYDYDTERYLTDGTFMMISDEYTIDTESTNEILYFVEHGNTAFISSNSFPETLLDSLGFNYNGSYAVKDTLPSWVVNPKLGNAPYNLISNSGTNYFSKIDTLKTTVLGYQKTHNEKLVNFIKIPYGKGVFYLHTQPVAFTNFQLLKNDNYQYAEKVLSYIPKGTIHWALKNQYGEDISDSPLRFIFSQPPLKWAWYLFIIGMLLFMIFNAKRRQRIIPEIKPLENTTVDFVKTIGNLYFQEGDYDTIIEKKIIYLLARIRQDYLMDTNVLDAEFIKKLQHKSGKNPEDIKQLFYLITNHRKKHHQSVEHDLIELNKAIEKFTA